MLWGAMETGQEAVPEIPVREAGGKAKVMDPVGGVQSQDLF